MNNLSDINQKENSIMKSISLFCNKYSIYKILKKSNAYKTKGFSVLELFVYLLQLVYTKKSMYMNMLTETHKEDFSKDVIYRFLNSTHINWSVFLLNLAFTVISKSIVNLTSKERRNVIIVDDSLYSRNKSKNVELLANVHNHASEGSKYKRGFRLLTAGWSDGCTFIPLSFRHLSSEKKKNRYNEINESIDKRSCGYKTRLQAIRKCPDVMLELLKEIVKVCVPAKHVLFDSWFSYPKTIIEVSKLALFVVARVKRSPKVMYLFQGEKKTLAQIYKNAKKRRGRSRYLLSVEVKLYNDKNDLVDAKIVYVKDRSNRKKWIAIISTDLSLTEDEIVEMYGKRWDIEVFFKICKSYLNLGKEFRGLSYDCMTAHTTIVMTRYILLALEKRENEDLRTMGELFFYACDELADINFVTAMNLIQKLFTELLVEKLFLDDKEIEELMDAFLVKLPNCIKNVFPYKNAS